MLQMTLRFSPATMDAIALEHVTKRFDSIVAVSDLNLCIRKARYFDCWPNGAGKTTPLRIIMHILAPDEG